MARSASPRRTARIARPIAVMPESAVPAKKVLAPRMPKVCETWKTAPGWSPSTKNSGAMMCSARSASSFMSGVPSSRRTVASWVIRSSSEPISLLPPR